MKLQTKRYIQEMHCCGDNTKDATLSISFHDGGDGDYLVLNMTEWAIDTRPELKQLFDEIESMLEVEG